MAGEGDKGLDDPARRDIWLNEARIAFHVLAEHVERVCEEEIASHRSKYERPKQDNVYRILKAMTEMLSKALMGKRKAQVFGEFYKAFEHVQSGRCADFLQIVLVDFSKCLAVLVDKSLEEEPNRPAKSSSKSSSVPFRDSPARIHPKRDRDANRDPLLPPMAFLHAHGDDEIEEKPSTMDCEQPPVAGTGTESAGFCPDVDAEARLSKDGSETDEKPVHSECKEETDKEETVEDAVRGDESSLEAPDKLNVWLDETRTAFQTLAEHIGRVCEGRIISYRSKQTSYEQSKQENIYRLVKAMTEMLRKALMGDCKGEVYGEFFKVFEYVQTGGCSDLLITLINFSRCLAAFVDKALEREADRSARRSSKSSVPLRDGPARINPNPDRNANRDAIAAHDDDEFEVKPSKLDCETPAAAENSPERTGFLPNFDPQSTGSRSLAALSRNWSDADEKPVQSGCKQETNEVVVKEEQSEECTPGLQLKILSKSKKPSLIEQLRAKHPSNASLSDSVTKRELEHREQPLQPPSDEYYHRVLDILEPKTEPLSEDDPSNSFAQPTMFKPSVSLSNRPKVVGRKLPAGPPVAAGNLPVPGNPTVPCTTTATVVPSALSWEKDTKQRKSAWQRDLFSMLESADKKGPKRPVGRPRKTAGEKRKKPGRKPLWPPRMPPGSVIRRIPKEEETPAPAVDETATDGKTIDVSPTPDTTGAESMAVDVEGATDEPDDEENDDKTKCDECDLDYGSNFMWKLHIQACHKRVICPVCKRGYQNESRMQKHMNRMHLTSTETVPPKRVRRTRNSGGFSGTATGLQFRYV